MLLSATQDPSLSYLQHPPRGNDTGLFAFQIRPVEHDEDPGCRESIEILTRNPKKGLYVHVHLSEPAHVSTIISTVSYDVHKDGIKVAVLTFAKSAYRLGETALGVVQLNHRASRTKVLKVRDNLFHPWSN